MTGLILVSLAAYTTIALLIKAAAAKTESNRLVTVALTTVTLVAAA